MPRLAPQELTIYPVPPDTARLQFLLRFTASDDLTGGTSRSLLERVIGTQDLPDVTVIFKPYGIAIHEGTFYVCDSRRPGIEVVDFDARSMRLLPLGGMAQLRVPINCAVDRDGLLYIADVGRNQVVVVDGTGEFMGTVGDGLIGRPGDVVARDDQIWVSSLTTRQVHVFDRESRQLLRSFPDAGPDDPGALSTPVNIAVSDDAVYVSDLIPAVVKVFSLDGEYVRTIGSRGTSIGQFGRPKGVAVDREGNVYVVDAAFENVQIFNSEGQLLLFFGGPYRKPGDMSLPAKVIVDYDNLEYFQEFVDPRFELKYLVIVTNQFGPDRVSVYGRVEERSLGDATVN